MAVSGVVDRIINIVRENPIIPIALLTFLVTQNALLALMLGVIAQLLLK